MKQSEERAISLYNAPPHAASIPHELIPLLPANWPAEIPLARITTCGPTISIAVLRQIHPGTDGHPTLVYGPPDDALLEEKGVSTALLLLSVLASQPHCSATKDWLSETLGHGNNDDEDDLDESPGLKRVDNVATQLRHLLFPPVLRDLPTANQLRRRLVISYRATRESGSGYRLAGLPLLWIDVEAIGEHLKQARALDQFGHDGLPAWQAAYELAGRGTFLEREPYSDWASWRRQQVETQLWQCVQALWRPLANQGEAGETEAVRILQSYWQSHITNEDVLRPLIELLGKREYYGQAEEYYAHLCLALEQESKQPDQRTQETMTFLRALQIQRKPSQYEAVSQETTKEQAPTTSIPLHNRTALLWLSDPQNKMPLHFAAGSILLQENDDTSAKIPEKVRVSLEVEIIAMALQWRQSSDSLVLLQQLTYNSIRKYDAMHKDYFNDNIKVTRRHALQAIATFPIQMYSLTRLVSDVRLMPLNELLPFCAAGITACWELRRYEVDGLLSIQHILSAYLPMLENVARQSSPYQSTSAYLASQGYLLINVLAEHYGKKEQMEAAARQARLYGKIAQNVNLEVSALIRLAIKFDYEHDDMKALEIYQEALALPGFSQVSPLLQGRVYAGLAGTYAYCSQTAQALSFLSQAKEIYPDEPESDPTYPFAICDGNTLALWEGLTLKHTDNHADAFSAFARFGTLAPLSGLLELNRVEHLNYAASVAIIQRNLDVAALYLDTAADVAWHIQDATRQSEVRDSLRSMRLLWPNEAKVKGLQEKLFAQQC